MLIVQKYGGRSLGRPDQIKSIAHKVAELHHQGHQVLVVVSAMGRQTDELVKLAYEVSTRPNRREMDMLLTTGERVSMALMSMALHDLQCPAISFTGSQAGVLTNGAHSNARVLDVTPMRVEQALAARKVVVLAGFQGVDPLGKEVTTLGRGGSDTTAVAMAAHFKAQDCQILKDVKGVHSADPHLVPEAQSLPELSYDSLAEMTYWGAKVLHFRAVVLARHLQVPLWIGLTTAPELGTRVQKEVSMYEQEQILSVNSHANVYHLLIRCQDMQEGVDKLHGLLQEAQLQWPQILATAFEGEQLRMMVTGDEENVKALLAKTIDHADIENSSKILSSVTLTCNGSVHSELPDRLLRVLKENGIKAEKLLATPLSVSAFIHQEHRERAVKALHKLITLPVEDR